MCLVWSVCPDITVICGYRCKRALIRPNWCNQKYQRFQTSESLPTILICSVFQIGLVLCSLTIASSGRPIRMIMHIRDFFWPSRLPSCVTLLDGKLTKSNVTLPENLILGQVYSRISMASLLFVVTAVTDHTQLHPSMVLGVVRGVKVEIFIQTGQWNTIFQPGVKLLFNAKVKQCFKGITVI